jgi:glycosyltransferase involved in cell wall biosynthesis
MVDAGLALAEHRERPYLVTVDDFLPTGARLRTSRRWCRRLIVTEPDLADEMTAALAVPPEFVQVVPPGVCVPSEPHQAFSSGRVPVVGTAGSLHPDAGLTKFLVAAKAVLDADIDAEFVIAGHGHDDSDVRRMVAHLELGERFTFVEDRGAMDRYWRVLDLFCQTSLVPTSGRTVSSAMARGIPAVVSGVAGLRSWIRPEENGLVVRPGDAAGFAAAIRRLLSDPEEARRLGAAARVWAIKHCDPAREASTLVALYHDSVRQSASVPRPRRLRKDAAAPS